MKRILAYFLILLGAVPVLTKVVVQIMIRLDYPIVINNEFLYRILKDNGTGIIIGGFFLGIFMIVIGLMILKKEKACELEFIEEQNLNPGEKVIFRQKSDSSVVVVTNQRVRYYGFFTEQLRRSVEDLPESDREDYPLKTIQKVKVVSNSDLMNAWINGKAKWGIQMELTNGAIVNIPTSGQDELTNQINHTKSQSQ